MSDPTPTSTSTNTTTSVKPSITVSKPTPYTFDLGLLLAHDPNPLPLTSDTSPSLEETLSSTAREGAQALLNQMLSTCPINSTPEGVLMTLPNVETPLPREKSLPAPKSQTTWSRFAAKKGIQPKTAEQRKKMVYDEDKGDWVPKWGYKGRNKEGEEDWIFEVDAKKEAEGREGRGAGVKEGRIDRKDRVKRAERRERANFRRVEKGRS